ncbi:MAG: nucleotidyl transferase AbiEii/AbiGii toxin family protein [Nocardiaceae bacterium]|nr:nucleotidyl transferase AbiEii/AbiGii toxin family protein [Nocardiaceae bacterium]
MTAPRPPRQIVTSLNNRLKNYADSIAQPVDRVRHRFMVGRFLARVFTAAPDNWVLKGGTGMMIRLPDARHSKDIDLMTPLSDDDAHRDLAALVRDNPVDYFSFDVTNPRKLSNGKGTTIKVTARIGPHQFGEFSIDLVSWRGLVGPLEEHLLTPIPALEDFPNRPTPIRLFPLADQIADKICAMYEKHQHGSTVVASSRTRDLVDLLLISSHLSFSLAETVAAIEYQRDQRNLTLPRKMVSPDQFWKQSWVTAARQSPLHASLHDFAAAIDAAGRCYNQALAALPTTTIEARWDPSLQSWS